MLGDLSYPTFWSFGILKNLCMRICKFSWAFCSWILLRCFHIWWAIIQWMICSKYFVSMLFRLVLCVQLSNISHSFAWRTSSKVFPNSCYLFWLKNNSHVIFPILEIWLVEFHYICYLKVFGFLAWTIVSCL